MGGLISAWRSWRERSQILRDMRRRAADLSEMTRFKVRDQLTFAGSALDLNDRRRAGEILDNLSVEYPTDLLQCELTLSVMLRLRRFEEATTMMRNGRKRYPRDPHYARGLADVAQALHNYDEAIELYAKMRKRFPGVVDGYTSAAGCLREINRLDEAESLVKPAMRQFPDKIAPFLEYARIAVARKDWEEALRRWQPIRDEFKYFGGYVGGAEALTQLGRFDEAEALLEQARYRFGTNPGPLIELARVAEARGDVAEAVKRWQGIVYRFPLEMPVCCMSADAWAHLRKSFPDNEEGYSGGAAALQNAGHPEEADAVREEHRLRFKST
jgi:tetratricopeptide (TPR) repeat protein